MCREERVKKQRSDDAILELVRPLDLVSGKWIHLSCFFSISLQLYSYAVVHRSILRTGYWQPAVDRYVVVGTDRAAVGMASGDGRVPGVCTRMEP